MEITKKFAKKIKEIAKDKKLKLGEIENQVGVTTGYLSRLDKNESEMRLDTALKFCQAVGMSLEEVMNYEPKYEVEWVNGTLYIMQGKKILVEVSKEQIVEVCEKVKNGYIKNVDEVFGGKNGNQ